MIETILKWIIILLPVLILFCILYFVGCGILAFIYDYIQSKKCEHHWGYRLYNNSIHYLYGTDEWIKENDWYVRRCRHCERIEYK